MAHSWWPKIASDLKVLHLVPLVFVPVDVLIPLSEYDPAFPSKNSFVVSPLFTLFSHFLSPLLPYETLVFYITFLSFSPLPCLFQFLFLFFHFGKHMLKILSSLFLSWSMLQLLLTKNTEYSLFIFCILFFSHIVPVFLTHCLSYLSLLSRYAFLQNQLNAKIQNRELLKIQHSAMQSQITDAGVRCQKK